MKPPLHAMRNRLVAASLFMALMLLVLLRMDSATPGWIAASLVGTVVFLEILYLIEATLRRRDADTLLWAFQTVVVVSWLIGMIVLIGELSK